MSAPPPVDASCCPLCGQANQCAQERARQSGQPPDACWCMQAHFSADVLARVPTALRGMACICARCAAQDQAPRTPAGG